MSDIIDRASDNEEMIRSAALSNRHIYNGFSAISCLECGEPIPEGRRLAVPGVKYCVCCQKDLK